MTYQFLHAETYSNARPFVRGKNGRTAEHETKRRWSARDVLGEADRLEGHIPHISKPERPTWLIGSVQDVMDAGRAWLEGVDPRTGKRVAINAPWLMAVVISLPADRRDDLWLRYRDDAIELFKMKYGPRLTALVEHLDEENPHLHAFLVPMPGETLGVLHPGKQASDDARRSRHSADGPTEGVGVGVAYRSAMRAWQDDWHANLCSRHGLGRFGPRRQRYTRAQWKLQKALEEIEAEITAAKERKRQAEDEARQCELEADKARAELREIQMNLVVARAGAESEMTEIRRETIAATSILEDVKNSLETCRLRAVRTLRRVRSRCISRRGESRRELEQMSSELQAMQLQHDLYMQNMATAYSAVRGPEIEELRATLQRVLQAVDRQDQEEFRRFLQEAQQIEREIPKVEFPPSSKRLKPPR